MYTVINFEGLRNLTDVGEEKFKIIVCLDVGHVMTILVYEFFEGQCNKNFLHKIQNI
jgi:hypothetical protein